MKVFRNSATPNSELQTVDEIGRARLRTPTRSGR
jgi:hypothetical protein